MHAFLLLGLLRAGRWQRTRCRTALSIEPAPAGFVGDEELEPDERCVQALWATDDGVLLAAGALVSRGNDFDLWIGDASDPSVGPNRQLRGAIPLALKLLVAFLAIETPATRLRAVPPPPPPRKRLADPLGGASSASAAALDAIGFCEGSDELLVLDDREAPERLTALALDGERDAVRALRLLGARRDWPLRDDGDRCRLVPEALSPDEVEAFRTADVQLSDGEDSVDGLPEQHAMLEGALAERALEIGARIARRAHRHDLVPAAAFLRRYDSGDAAGRAALGPHFDARPTVATAVVDLDPAAYEGGGYFVQSHPHCSSRRLVPFAADGRDACLHNAELIHGVATVCGIRSSLVVWYNRRDGAEKEDDDPDVLFAKAATPPGNSLFLHRAAAAGSANAHALLGTLADARGADSSAIEHWTAAARAGHASAADALADALESDVWRELADVDPFARRQV